MTPEMRAAEDARRLKQLRTLIEGLAAEVASALEHRRTRGLGGQQVPFHGDFASAGPPSLARLRWWLRELCTTAGVELPPELR